jgi:NAD(P)-dependent dehydrogenase (short-subunit alcohol dehydrogenase family)
MVTGATGGLGYETALALAKAGAEVVLTGRDDQKGRSAVE